MLHQPLELGGIEVVAIDLVGGDDDVREAVAVEIGERGRGDRLRADRLRLARVDQPHREAGAQPALPVPDVDAAVQRRDDDVELAVAARRFEVVVQVAERRRGEDAGLHVIGLAAHCRRGQRRIDRYGESRLQRAVASPRVDLLTGRDDDLGGAVAVDVADRRRRHRRARRRDRLQAGRREVRCRVALDLRLHRETRERRAVFAIDLHLAGGRRDDDLKLACGGRTLGVAGAEMRELDRRLAADVDELRPALAHRRIMVEEERAPILPEITVPVGHAYAHREHELIGRNVRLPLERRAESERGRREIGAGRK